MFWKSQALRSDVILSSRTLLGKEGGSSEPHNPCRECLGLVNFILGFLLFYYKIYSKQQKEGEKLGHFLVPGSDRFKTTSKKMVSFKVCCTFLVAEIPTAAV